MTEAHWSHFPHSADLGICGVGPTAGAAFEQAACALFAAITNLDGVAAAARVDIRCHAPDVKLLFVDWLNALIYEAGVRKMIFSRFAVKITGLQLEGQAWGEPIDARRHAPAIEPKGATFTELRVEPLAEGSWIAQCVVDV